MLDAQQSGRSAVVPRQRLDSHRLIEEFMILANVAAAEELEARRQPCMYRVHDAPDPDEARAACASSSTRLGVPGLALAKGQAIRPELFNRVLRAGRRHGRRPRWSTSWCCAARRRPSTARTISAISAWRCARYAHFTSPIRRYADLLVHRALLGDAVRETGDDGLDAIAGAHLGD